MKYIKDFKLFERYKYKYGRPVPKSIINQWLISGYLKPVPVEILKEIRDWPEVFKSPISFSFYNKIKGWNNTENGTIRFSDHWNFISRGKKHCKTIQSGIEQNQWAKGIYDSSTDLYDIVEYYSPSTREEYDKFIEISNISFEGPSCPIKPGIDIISFGRHLHDEIEKGDVFFKSPNLEGKVIRFKALSILVEDSIGNRTKVEIKRTASEKTIKTRYNFTITLDNKEYSAEEILRKLGKLY